MECITKRQGEVLDYISGFIDINGFPPTLREIGCNFNFSFHAAACHLKALEKKGVISTNKGLSRTIKINKQTYV